MITKLLLAPDLLSGGGIITADPNSDPSALKGWMSMVADNQIEGEDGTKPVDPPPKKEPNGKPDAKSDGTEGDGVSANAKPVSEPDVNPADAAPVKPVADATPKPDAKPGNAEAKKAEVPGKEDKMPRSSTDWDKYKKVHAEKEAKLQAEVTTWQTRHKELEAKVKEIEQKATQAGAVPPEATKELEAVKKENEEMSNRLRVLDVTQHPKFQAFFDGKVNAQKDLAKRIVGADKFGEFEEVLALPEGKYKNDQLDAFVADLPMLQQSRIGGVLNTLEAINQERSEEISKSSELRTKLTEEEKGRAQKTQADSIALRDKLTAEAVAELSDPETGWALFQKKEGDDAWNGGVDARIGAAKRLLTGKDMKPADFVKAAFHATAFPDLLQAYSADMKARDETIAGLEAQVKKLSAAQPKGGADTNGGDTKSGARFGQNPFEAAESFTKNLWASE